MRHLLRWFMGYLHISLRGRQISRFLNLCSRNGISIWSIRKSIDHNLHFHIRLRDFYYLKPFLRKTRTHLRILGRHGYPFWCYRHPRLKWFPVFAMALLCIYLYSTTFIWNIRISGNEAISSEEIIAFLEEQDIRVGKPLEKVDCVSLETQMRQSFLGLGWVSVYLQDTKLCIDIKESLYGVLEENMRPDGRYDIFANKDAYILSIITRKGKALTPKNTYVKQGDCLVQGICPIYNDSGEVQQILKLPAEAQIIGEVQYSYYDIITEMDILSMKIADSYTNSSIKALAEQKICHFLENLEENGVIILSKRVMIERQEHGLIIHLFVTAQEEIGITLPVEEEI